MVLEKMDSKAGSMVGLRFAWDFRLQHPDWSWPTSMSMRKSIDSTQFPSRRDLGATGSDPNSILQIFPWLVFKVRAKEDLGRGGSKLAGRECAQEANRSQTFQGFSSRYQWEERANHPRLEQIEQHLRIGDEPSSRFYFGHSIRKSERAPGDFGEVCDSFATTFDWPTRVDSSK